MAELLVCLLRWAAVLAPCLRGFLREVDRATLRLKLRQHQDLAVKFRCLARDVALYRWSGVDHPPRLERLRERAVALVREWRSISNATFLNV